MSGTRPYGQVARPWNPPGLNRDNAISTPVDPGLIQRISGGLRSWLGMSGQQGSPELPFFPPGEPIPPVAPGAAGRRFDYPSSYNINIRPRTYEPIGFETLRAMADPTVGGYDLIRLAIETRKDQMSTLTSSVLPRKPAGQPMRPKSDDRCTQVEELLRVPDGHTAWQQWCSQLVEEHLVIDAPAIYRRRSLSGATCGLELMDGALFRPLLNYDGRRPSSGPAYQQILKGLPAVNYTKDELLYAPRNPRVNKVYGYCYLPDHQVLTRRGWLPFTEVTLGDEIATRNPRTKTFEWQHPTEVIAMPHRGEVYRFHSRSVDLVVTPKHRMLLDSMPSAATGRRRTRGQGGEVLVEAAEIARGYNRMNKIPMTSVWEGVEVEAKTFALAEPDGMIDITREMSDGTVQVFTRRRHRGSEKPIEVSGDDYCALMGAYVAEGNIRSQGGIEINQREYSKGYLVYGQLVARVLGGPAQYNGKAFVLPRRGLTEHFRTLGLQPERFIPDEIMQASIRQLRIFWDHFVLGDGCYQKRPNVSGRGGHPGEPAVAISTSSARLADQLQEIAQKLGWSASVGSRPGGLQPIVGREYLAKDQYLVNVRYSKAMGFTITPDWYEGNVHCVSVPNRVIYVRRNGKPAWCGNSCVEQVLVTVNIGLRRQAGQLAFFTDGNIPDAITQVPPEWGVEKIREFQDYWDTMVNDAVTRRRMRFVPGGVTMQKTRADDALVDAFDEWLARIIAYCFSLPPTPFVKMQNRATAETAYETALSEGLMPLMIWLKGVVDYIIANWLGFPDLELIWDDVKKTDPAEKEERDLALIGQGVISRDDMRAERGLEPLGIPPIVTGIGPLGFMSIEAMKKAIANGWDLTGMPQPGLGAGGDVGAAGGDPAQFGTGGQGDPLAGMPPEILEALGMSDPSNDPNSANGGATAGAVGANGAGSPIAGAQPVPGTAGAPVIGGNNVVPLHQHPAVKAALAVGHKTATRMAARMPGAGR
jgi:hypothetical protein